MSQDEWTDEENALIVADYFAMLADDIAGRPYNKAAHRRALRSRLNGRTEAAIEFKHRNISAVLRDLGETWIPGYFPAANYQASLIRAVLNWLDQHEDWLELTPAVPLHVREEGLWIGPPPSLSNQPPVEPRSLLTHEPHFAHIVDVAARDERNRKLGRAGEELVLQHEWTSLRSAGRADLARKVRWVAKEDGDGLGYDIESFTPEGHSRLIEVKTTNGAERTPFMITRNELAVARERKAEWRLVRVSDFRRTPKAFELVPPLDAHVSLEPTSFRARF